MADGDDDSGNGSDDGGFTPARFRDTGVVSSCFSRIEYDENEKRLAMTFAKDGRRYIIDGIEPIEVHRWIDSGSPGGYFNSFVRGVY